MFRVMLSTNKSRCYLTATPEKIQINENNTVLRSHRSNMGNPTTGEAFTIDILKMKN